MAVEFPVNPPGIIPGDIGPVVGQVVGSLKMGLRSLGVSPGLDIHRDRLRSRRGQGQKPGASVLGYGEKNPEKSEAVGDNKPVVGAVIGPPFPDRKKPLIILKIIGIKDMPDNPPVPGQEPQLVPDKDAGETEKAPPPGSVPGQEQFPPISGAYISEGYPYRKGPGVFFMDPGEDQTPQETIGQNRDKNRIHQGKGQFFPQTARNQGQQGDDPDGSAKKPGYGYTPGIVKGF
jgi:hypothetical protein